MLSVSAISFSLGVSSDQLAAGADYNDPKCQDPCRRNELIQTMRYAFSVTWRVTQLDNKATKIKSARGESCSGKK